MSFLAFADAKVDIAVMETGLGGRLDATNIITPLTTVITMIDREHTRVLGDTLNEIAREKAGIIKPGIPLVCGENKSSEAGCAIEEIARERQAPTHWLNEEFSIENVAAKNMRHVFDFRSPELNLESLDVGILGRHQLNNIGLALTALCQVAKTGLFKLNETAHPSDFAGNRLACTLGIFPISLRNTLIGPSCAFGFGPYSQKYAGPFFNIERFFSKPKDRPPRWIVERQRRRILSQSNGWKIHDGFRDRTGITTSPAPG